MLSSNTEVLQASGIDITVPLNLDVLVGSTFKRFNASMHAQYVYLVAANLANTEYRITDQGLKDLQLAVFAYVTGHDDYRSALDPPDRRMIYDDGRVQLDDDEGLF